MMEVKEGGYYESRYFEKRPNGSVWISNLGGPKDVVDEWYQTSQIGNRSLEFIEAAVEAGKPFIAYLGPHAPHYRQGGVLWDISIRILTGPKGFFQNCVKPDAVNRIYP